MPAVADRAVWEKVTKGRAGMRWDSVVEENMKGYRRKPRRDNVHREVCEVQDRSKGKGIKKGKASTKKQGEGGGPL